MILLKEKEAEIKLLDSESRMKALFDTSPDGIIVCDLDDGLFVDVNPKALELFKTSLSEFMKSKPIRFKP